MLLTRLLNACHHFPGFVYERARLRQDLNLIEVQVRPRHGSRPRCSGCQHLAAGYDRLAERRTLSDLRAIGVDEIQYGRGHH